MKPKKRTYPEEGKKNPETTANKATQGESQKPGAAPAQEGKMVGKLFNPINLTDKKYGKSHCFKISCPACHKSVILLRQVIDKRMMKNPLHSIINCPACFSPIALLHP